MRICWNKIFAMFIYQGLVLVILVKGYVMALKCWSCFGDKCTPPLEGNQMASKKECKLGQSCMKVQYRGRTYKDYQQTSFSNLSQDYYVEYTSTVRSCSQNTCSAGNDNCTYDKLFNPGCRTVFCCNDNLCNSAEKTSISTSRAKLALLAASLLVITIYFLL